MIGGAILPSLLHQDPRYFYQGTGTTRSRILQAVSSPFVCRGDNGGLQPNSVQLRGPRNLGGEIELSGAEHPPVEVQKAPAARQKWLDSVMVKEIDLSPMGTPASSVSIRALAIRLRITHYRKWDHFGNIA
jgi:hypothetical protein